MSGQRDELAGPPAPEESVWNALHDTGREQFDNFFECWIGEQERYLQELQAASPDPSLDDGQLRRLISTVVQHYEHYYMNKAIYAKHNVTAMFSPSWTSTLEDALLWVGGWRPSTAFHLLYSKSGIEFESHLESLLRGVAGPDVGHLSLRQLAQVDELQRRIIKEEREITEKQAELQETVANVTMVELSHAVTERRLKPETAAERVETSVESMSEGLQKVLEKADNLRLRTLKDLVDLLNPIQAVHFLTAAAELHLRLHEWGKQRDGAAAAAACA
ncbi:protein DOG1-like 4 [Aristolochia californica]|uniref:protein DOG1-like 4 n=1 Tax=Aristolochia californica TaxID=171875 RepID=UPI0035E38C8C